MVTKKELTKAHKSFDLETTSKIFAGILDDTLDDTKVKHKNKKKVDQGATKPSVKKPKLYKVLLLNDDFTPMEFVVHVLQTVFSKSSEDAYEIMLTVHNKGSAVCGIYTRDVAETKAEQVTGMARYNEYPLQPKVEQE